MKTKSFKSLILAMACAAVTLCGCSEKDLFEPKPIEDIKSADEYFDFSTRKGVTVNINYGLPGYKALFSLYTENPLKENGYDLKEGVTPVYSAFTNEDNTFNATVNLPSATKKVYLYSYYYGLPTCVELDATSGAITFDNSEVATRADETVGYEGTCASIGANKATISRDKKLYALYNRVSDTGVPTNSRVSKIYSTVGNKADIGNGQTLGNLYSRITPLLGSRTEGSKSDNTKYIGDADKTNISISPKTADGKDVESAHIDLVFLNSNPGGFKNSLGYYYYKTGTELSAQTIADLPKYMVFPYLPKGSLTQGYRARLQFFGEDYTSDGVDHFPAGYTIGWCLIANTGASSASEANNKISSSYPKRAVYSNYYKANQERPGFITLYDRISGKLVLGVEDTSFQDMKGQYSDNSYEDLLFYVDADPIAAIVDPENPGVPVVEEEEILEVETTEGILAFEDIWPTGGDYDMNDVVIKYSSVVTFNQKNEIKKIVDTFTPIHDGADYLNAFGYVINGGNVGEINAEQSNYLVKEESDQFIFFANAKTVQNQEFKLVREYSEGSYPSKVNYVRNYNPFIVVHYEQGVKDRTEVHLPKYSATGWANQFEIDASENPYYIKADGTYPFAIDLPVETFKVAIENIVSIDEAYPQFKAWTESKGATNADWYLYPEADKVQ